MRNARRRAERHTIRDRLWLAGRYLGLWLLAVCLVLAATLYLQFTHDRNLAVARETGRLSLVSSVLVRYLDTVAVDLAQLAQERALQAYLRTGLEEDRQRAARELYTFAKHKHRYAQVRLIGRDGRERIRVDRDNGSIHLVTDDALQDKSRRYYFSDGMGMPPGQIYVSQMDLNVEHGQIEQPYRPTLRFALPLRDDSGAAQALVVLNLNAELLLSRFDQAAAAAHGSVELLNGDGYWLRSVDRSREWGFMFDHGPGFAAQKPELWSRVRAHDNGVVDEGEGLLLYATVHPLPTVEEANVGGVPHYFDRDALRWKVVSELSEGVLLADLREQHGLGYGAAFLVLLLAGGAGSWVLAVGSLERRLIQRERQLHASIFDVASDAILLTDANGAIINVNAAFSLQSGYTRGEVIGQRPQLLQSGCQDDSCNDQLWSHLREHGQWQGELWHQRKDGSIYPVSLRIAAIRDVAGDVIAYVGLTTDITARRQAEDELRRQANHDHLTGLVSRRLFRDRLDQAMAWARRANSRVELCFLDLDRFKPINDAYGHEAGDHVLRTLAKRMQESLRDVDTLARIGGDEFVVILTGRQDADVLETAVERMQLALREPIDWQGHELRLGSSVGIALFPDDGADADDLLRKADAAMYAAKQTGKGGWVRYHAGLADAPVVAGGTER